MYFIHVFFIVHQQATCTRCAACQDDVPYMLPIDPFAWSFLHPTILKRIFIKIFILAFITELLCMYVSQTHRYGVFLTLICVCNVSLALHIDCGTSSLFL